MKSHPVTYRAGIHEHVDYVFEAGDDGQGTTKEVLEELFAKPNKRKAFAFNSLRFAQKGECPGLELADIFAFEIGRYVPLALGWETSPERKCFQELRRGNQHYTMLLDFDELAKLAAARRLRMDQP